MTKNKDLEEAVFALGPRLAALEDAIYNLTKQTNTCVNCNAVKNRLLSATERVHDLEARLIMRDKLINTQLSGFAEKVLNDLGTAAKLHRHKFKK